MCVGCRLIYLFLTVEKAVAPVFEPLFVRRFFLRTHKVT